MKKIIYLFTLLLVFNFGYGQTTLAKEDIAIIGVNTDNEDFTFLLRTDITAGTTIYFSDNEVNAAGTGLNDDNEGVVLFTALTAYNCGTVLSFVANSSEFTVIDNTFQLANNSGEVVLAFQGYNPVTLEWTTFLHANTDPAINLPAGFTAADIVDGTFDNREYNGNRSNPSWAELNNITNYHQSNNYASVTLNTTAFSCSPCPTTTTWTGTWSNGLPNDLTKNVVINSNYNTTTGDIMACILTVDAGATLTIGNNSFAEVEHDVTNNGTIVVETQGNFVQNDDAGIFTNNGTSIVNKQTASKADWFYYTYWSSPVTGETIGSVFPDVDGDRRFWFNAANFVDTDGDDIDDNGDDWQPAYAADAMIPGVGYAATESRFFFGGSGTASFEGQFNTGDIDVSITLNGANPGINWNFIGNPYPSAVDFDAFHAANATVVDGAAYFWSQFTPHAESNPGNEQSNFSKNDYATYTVGSGGVAGASGVTPTQYIPSAQGFFIPALTTGTATFTNAMRMADGTSNSLFFKGSNKSKSSNIANRLWLNLTTENGVFGQILLAYVEGATNGNDGLSYDAPKLVSEDYAAILYSKMDASPMKYVIQGKDINRLNEDEIIKLGFSSTIEDNTAYKLSIAQFEGDFLSSNPIYIKDNFLNELHDLSTSDYTFNSEDGTFNDRFEIVFSNKVLSTNEFDIEPNSLRILEIDDNHVQFTTSSPIKTIKIFDLLGRQLYELNGNSNQETYNLSSLDNTIFIAKAELLNGATITKKAIKK
ncbi:hypothetical protein [Algibacter luteus]|uniref:hypothetical protein n=1 Tax=Algibacter luteus TaxID=1178825 RepID=UPI0025979530|nr:hypothetical protein [Algibacter luteus]WJJ97217.1 hypothetical protein O5O44_02310 [Algibacter luteus]